MKKILYTLLAGTMTLASCSKSDDAPNLPQSDEQLATFSIAVERVQTRSEVTGLSRYIVEAYENGNLSAVPVRVEATTGSLTIPLKKETEYTFVFWADKGTAKSGSAVSSGYYNTDNLKEVTVSAGKKGTVGEVAYCLTKSFNSKVFDQNNAVTLKNATAQINFVEASGLMTADNSLTVKYMKGVKLDVTTGMITEIDSEISHTYTNIGMIHKDGTLMIDYILAPLNDQYLLNLKVTFNTEPEKSIDNVPLQQSYKTNVKGEYSNRYASTFTISNEVEDYTENPDVEFSVYKVGGIYPNDLDGKVVSLDKNVFRNVRAVSTF